MRISHGFATAPIGAAQAIIVVRAITNGQADPYVFFSRCYLGEAGAGQTEVSPWTPGRGIYQITQANASTYIANAAIGTAQIQDASITAAKIGSLALVGTNNFSVRTATTGARMEMDSRAIKIFDANGVLRVQLGDLTV